MEVLVKNFRKTGNFVLLNKLLKPIIGIIVGIYVLSLKSITSLTQIWVVYCKFCFYFILFFNRFW